MDNNKNKPRKRAYKKKECANLSKEDHCKALSERRERNRLAAQNCRLRKQQYIRELEDQNKQLSQDLELYKYMLMYNNSEQTAVATTVSNTDLCMRLELPQSTDVQNEQNKHNEHNVQFFDIQFLECQNEEEEVAKKKKVSIEGNDSDNAQIVATSPYPEEEPSCSTIYNNNNNNCGDNISPDFDFIWSDDE